MVEPCNSKFLPSSSEERPKLNTGKWSPEEELSFTKACLVYGTKMHNFPKVITNRTIEQIRKHKSSVIKKLKQKYDYDPIKNNYDDVQVSEQNATALDSATYEKIILRMFTKEKDEEEQKKDSEMAVEKFRSRKRKREANQTLNANNTHNQNNTPKANIKVVKLDSKAKDTQKKDEDIKKRKW